MRNIHVLPTDKPSSIWIDNDVNKLVYGLFSMDNIHNCKNQNIHITSDELKEGGWTLMFDDFGNLFLCDKPQQYLGIEKGHYLNKNLRKIILTTDQDLIKDGVQSIPGEFLEWFVKNPSCEAVEVVKGFPDGTNYGYNFLDYKIIIPSEEPKQTDERGNPLTYWGGLEKPKKETLEEKLDKIVSKEPSKFWAESVERFKNQETLEEAAVRYAEMMWGVYYDDTHPDIAITQTQGEITVKDFIAGYKLAQERSYSEEEVIDLNFAYLKYLGINQGSWVNFKEWFNKFKKQIK